MELFPRVPTQLPNPPGCEGQNPFCRQTGVHSLSWLAIKMTNLVDPQKLYDFDWVSFNTSSGDFTR